MEDKFLLVLRVCYLHHQVPPAVVVIQPGRLTTPSTRKLLQNVTSVCRQQETASPIWQVLPYLERDSINVDLTAAVIRHR